MHRRINHARLYSSAMRCAILVVSFGTFTVGEVRSQVDPASNAAGVPAAEVPAKASWKASASALQEEMYPASFAVDGNSATRWSSPWSDPHYLLIDLGSITTVSGLTILWEAAFAADYTVLTSTDAKSWREAYSTDRGDGEIDELFFPPVSARYVKILGTKRATSWGYSIREVDVRGLSDRPRISVAGATTSDPNNLLDGKLSSAWEAAGKPPWSLVVDLRKERPFVGMRIDWGKNHATKMSLATSTDGKQWKRVSEINEGEGRFDLLFCSQTAARFLRLEFTESANDRPIQIAEISLKAPNETLSQLGLYQFVAEKAKPGLYPDHLRKRQVYWTVVGTPGDAKESLLDEYGNIEPYAKSGSIMPFIFSEGELQSAFDASQLTQEMRGGYLPLPSVTWELPNIKLRIEAVAHGSTGETITYARYTIRNTSQQQQQGKLLLAIRPVQINPIWQYGGLSLIRAMEFAKTPEGLAARVNGDDLCVSLSEVDAFGARPFDNGDVVRDLAKGEVPQAAHLADNGEYISGALEYDFDLKPGESKSVVLAIPLFGVRDELRSRLAQNTPPDARFNQIKKEMTAFWQQEIDRVVFDVPDHRVVNTLKSQIGYILINQDGVSIQPGSRNYKRCWMRDGSLTSAALLRMGQTDVVRRYLDWYAERVLPDGLVPPILNNDGTVNGGFGSNLEYDSQGQFVFAVMEYYRFTRDKEFLAKHYDKLKLALQFLVQLRAQTLAPDYMQNEPARERFVGILPPSYSHEGYSPPMHSYWDDYFALKGWKDGKAAAEVLGDAETAEWADEQYHLFRDSLTSSIAATMAYKQIDFIPGCADKGDLDPTSTTIALFPCDEQELLPADALRNMYSRYHQEVVNRTKPDFRGGYTPYEIRNITSFVRLGMQDNALFLLDYILGCRRPADWNHLAEVVLADERLGSYIGDMPHTWVGSGYINAVRGMVVQERDGKLVLFAGTPERWLRDGNGIELGNLPTYFGKLDLTAHLQEATLTLTIGGSIDAPQGIEIRWPIATKPASVTVDGKAWTDFDAVSCKLPKGARKVVVQW